MSIAEKLDFKPVGKVTVRQRDPLTGKSLKVLYSRKQNLIVTEARQIIRDLLVTATDSDVVNTIQLGDMNMAYGDDTSDLPKPVLSDTTLVNPFFSKQAENVEKTVIEGRYALRCNFLITKSEANSSDPSQDNKLITELALLTQDSRMFSRIVLPIVKIRSAELQITWEITI